jgi:hypothetical protein
MRSRRSGRCGSSWVIDLEGKEGAVQPRLVNCGIYHFIPQGHFRLIKAPWKLEALPSQDKLSSRLVLVAPRI